MSRSKKFGMTHITGLVAAAIFIGLLGAGKGCGGEEPLCSPTGICTPDHPLQSGRQK